MKRRQILKAFLFPPIAVVILLSIIAGGGLIYSFAGTNVHPAISYVCYFMSAYAFTVVCVRSPNIVKHFNKYRKSNPYIVRYQSDALLRTKISLYANVSINIVYAASHLLMGALYQSLWFYALSGYYALLAIMRFYLLEKARKTGLGDHQRQEYCYYRVCGYVLLLMNIALSVIVFYIVWGNKGFSYHYIMTIAMAAYTFTAFTMAIINMVKYRKYHSPILSAVKQISFASALVSMLSLETAMLAAFGDTTESEFSRIMTASTGACVCSIILIMAICMIAHSTKQIKALSNR